MTKKNEVLVFEEKKVYWTTSLDVAEKFEKRHDNVLQTIRELQEQLPDFSRLHYKESIYTKRGKEYPCFNISRDGLSLLVMGFTGAEALQWKIKYIN